MPTYTYTCTSCTATIEKRQSFSDAPLTTCEVCGGALRKVIYPVGIVFKGSGWYSTDSRKASASAVNGDAKSESDGESAASKDSNTSKESKDVKKESADTKAEKAEKRADAPTASASSTSSTPASATPTPKD